MNKAEAFLSDFEGILRAFNTAAVVLVSTLTSRHQGIAYNSHQVIVRESSDPTAAVVCAVTADDKSAALQALTTKLREVYPAPVEPSTKRCSTTDKQKQELLTLINRGCFERSTKSHVMLNINVWSEVQAAAKIAELQAAIEKAENGPYETQRAVLAHMNKEAN
jgi:hypothetical protein